jgi:hypothetical protein
MIYALIFTFATLMDNFITSGLIISEASHDWKFTFEGLIQFEHYIDLEKFQDDITFWVDNGFRNHECLYAFWFLSQNLQIPLFVNFLLLIMFQHV